MYIVKLYIVELPVCRLDRYIVKLSNNLIVKLLNCLIVKLY